MTYSICTDLTSKSSQIGNFGRDDRSWTCLTQFPKLVGDRYPTSRIIKYEILWFSVSGQICGQTVFCGKFWNWKSTEYTVFSRLFGVFAYALPWRNLHAPKADALPTAPHPEMYNINIIYDKDAFVNNKMVFLEKIPQKIFLKNFKKFRKRYWHFGEYSI